VGNYRAKEAKIYAYANTISRKALVFPLRTGAVVSDHCHLNCDLTLSDCVGGEVPVSLSATELHFGAYAPTLALACCAKHSALTPK